VQALGHPAQGLYFFSTPNTNRSQAPSIGERESHFEDIPQLCPAVSETAGSKTFIDQGKLYGSMGDRTQSVDPASGKVIWSRTLNDRKMTAASEGALTPPAIVNGKVFVGNNSGDLYVLSAATGDVLWSAHLGEAISFQPAVAGGHVYVATNQGTLYCLSTRDSADDGWVMWGGSAGHNGPAEHANRR
jgi:outer membrane protein assembly factor BamB